MAQLGGRVVFSGNVRGGGPGVHRLVCQPGVVPGGALIQGGSHGLWSGRTNGF